MNTQDNNRYLLNENRLRSSLSETMLAPWTNALVAAVHARSEQLHHGELSAWCAAVNALPDLDVAAIQYDHEQGVAVLTQSDIDAEQKRERNNDEPVSYSPEAHAGDLESVLKRLCPWRKGPYRVSHVHIDSEWRSDWKWNRLSPHITPLSGRTVLDVGCGNGYHLWRMRNAGAAAVIGIDPGLLFLMQFEVLQHYINDSKVVMLPLTMETMPENMQCFDTTFSMGVLYHRKNAAAHLTELRQSLRPGGELVLETLVALGEEATVLDVDDRYARMRNVWQLPSVPMLARWLKEAGFSAIRCVSVDITSRLEQRTTQWMPFESLTESLDPNDLSLTVEGHPRPRRAVMIATAL